MRLVTALLFSVLSFAAPSFNLPGDVVPKKYTADLTIDPSKDTFTGVVRIDVKLKTSTDHIWINAKDVTPIEASVDKKMARAEAVGNEFLDLALDSPVGPGHATITIRYQGKLDENSVVGPYRKEDRGRLVCVHHVHAHRRAARVSLLR